MAGAPIHVAPRRKRVTSTQPVTVGRRQEQRAALAQGGRCVSLDVTAPICIARAKVCRQYVESSSGGGGENEGRPVKGVAGEIKSPRSRPVGHVR